MRFALLGLSLLSIFLFIATLSCTNIAALSQFPLCGFISGNSLIIGSGAIHLGLLSIALFFLYTESVGQFFKTVGFPGNPKTTAIYTIAGLIAMFALLFAIGILSAIFGFNDQSKILDKVSGLPWYILALAVVVAPFTEELFFRALLVPRLGIVLSAVIFGISHITYGSVVEVAGVLAVGLVLGYIYRRTGSITPCIAIHLIYNFISISAMLLMKSAI